MTIPVETRLTEAQCKTCMEKFGLSYHVNYAADCQELAGFQGKDVLEVGGSLPREFVFDYLKVKSWTAVETDDYEISLKEADGITHKGTVIGKIPDNELRTFDGRPLGEYNVIIGNIEDLPGEYYERFDLVFSIAAFEHILSLKRSLDMMYFSLRNGGKLFSLYSPVWSSPIGHHLPDMVDKNGKHYNFSNSPIPPWGHLLQTPPQLYQYLLNHTDNETAEKMVYYVYNAPNINRFFTEDHIGFINLSLFQEKKVDLVFLLKIEKTAQKILEKQCPGYQYFSNMGIRVLLGKQDETLY